MAASERAPTRPPITERQLQEAIIQCAEALGWRVYHPWLSLNSADGYPDLTMTRRGRLIFAELKSATGKVSEAQAAWLADLGEVPAIGVYLWTPEAWLSGEIEGVLR